MRISGITIPDSKHLEVGLTAIYGIGRSRAREILEKAGVAFDTRAKDLNEKDEARIRKLVEEHTIEGDLKREASGNIKRLKDIKTYKGVRHSKGLKVRGQRSKTNARTVPTGLYAKTRKRVTMGSGRRKVEKK